MADKKQNNEVPGSGIPQIPRYRIGDYARYMGVTPDFLKHYEDMGLVVSERADNGYRYYPFTLSPLLMRCIGLRNYGFTLKEIQSQLNFAPRDREQSYQIIRDRVTQMEKETDRTRIFLEDYHNVFGNDLSPYREDGEWLINRCPDMYFLPHSSGFHFIDDPRIQDIVHYWMAQIPVVKSALRISENREKIWGLIVKKSYAQALDLPVNDVVEHIHPTKTLFYYYQSPPPLMAMETKDNPDHPVFRLLKQMNLTPVSRYFRISLQYDAVSQGIEVPGCYTVPVQLKEF